MKNNYVQPTPDIVGMVKASGLKEKAIFTLIAIAVFRFLAQVPLFGLSLLVLIHPSDIPKYLQLHIPAHRR